MKKISVFLLVALVFGVQNLNAETLSISRSNKLGVTLADQIQISKASYTLNGIPLAKSRHVQAQQYVSLLKKMKPSSTACGAGRFIILIEDGKLKKEISGCAEGAEYGKLIAQLYTLKKGSQP